MEHRVDFKGRLIAGLIDVGILFAVALLLNFSVGLFSTSLAQLLMFAAALGLVILPEAMAGQSFGKKKRGIIIRSADGSAASSDVLMKRAVIKSVPSLIGIVASLILLVGLAKISSMVSMVSGLVGLALFAGCFLALKPERKTLHDQLAQTAVYPVDND